MRRLVILIALLPSCTNTQERTESKNEKIKAQYEVNKKEISIFRFDMLPYNSIFNTPPTATIPPKDPLNKIELHRKEHENVISYLHRIFNIIMVYNNHDLFCSIYYILNNSIIETRELIIFFNKPGYDMERCFIYLLQLLQESMLVDIESKELLSNLILLNDQQFKKHIVETAAKNKVCTIPMMQIAIDSLFSEAPFERSWGFSIFRYFCEHNGIQSNERHYANIIFNVIKENYGEYNKVRNRINDIFNLCKSKRKK